MRILAPRIADESSIGTVLIRFIGGILQRSHPVLHGHLRPAHRL